MSDFEPRSRSNERKATAGPSADDRYGPGQIGVDVEGRILRHAIVGGQTQITISRGLSAGVKPDMEGYVKGANGVLAELRITAVKENMSFAIVDVTPDVLGTHWLVVINPTTKPATVIRDNVTTRVISVSIEGGRTKIIIPRGSAHGVSAGTVGHLRAADGRDGDGFIVEGTTANQAFAFVRGTVDYVNEYSTVILHPANPKKGPVQRRAAGNARVDNVENVAQAGVAGAASQLPFFETIQRAFGRHDISSVQAQVGGAAADASAALGAKAYATGDKVAFASAPDLHTAAHEAAHTVQQRRGAVGFQGLGAADDEHERHADEVADAVVAGRSAEPLLDQLGGGGATRAIQRKEDLDYVPPKDAADPTKNTFVKRDRPVLDWRSGRQPRTFPNPVQPLNCVFDGEVPTTHLAPPSRSHRSQDIDDAGDQRQLAEMRSAWRALQETSGTVSATHATVGAEVTAYRNARADPQLRALLFFTPGRGGDLASFANQQELPARGGPTVADLFDPRGEPTLDDASLASLGAQRATKHQPHTAGAVPATAKSDAQLKAAYHEVHAKLKMIQAKRAKLQEAYENAIATTAEASAEFAQEEIDELKEEAAKYRELSDAAFAFLSGLAHASAGEVGDFFDKVGVLVGTLVGQVHDRRIAALERYVKSARSTMRTARGRQAAARIEEATHELAASFTDLDASKERLNMAFADRRSAYNQLGAAAASEFEAPEDAKRKLGASLAAIPIAELVIARAFAIVTNCQLPEYTDAAGHGLWIAMMNARPEVTPFLRALSEIEGSRFAYTQVWMEWQGRLSHLRRIEQLVVGERPGAGP